MRYIGCTTKSLDVRLKNHLKGHKKKTYKQKWIKKLQSSGLEPKIKIIETCEDKEHMVRQEVWWINYFKKRCDLTNATKGGEGVSGYKFSDEQRKMISIRTKEAMKKLSPEKKKRMRESKMGRPANNRVKIIDHFGNIYPSLTSAANTLSVSVSAITHGIKNKRPVREYSFKYLTEDNSPSDVYENKKLKPVKCVELNKSYRSCREAGKSLNLDASDIGRAAKGTLKTCGGYTFEFIRGGV